MRSCPWSSGFLEVSDFYPYILYHFSDWVTSDRFVSRRDTKYKDPDRCSLLYLLDPGAFNTGGGRGLNVPSFVGNAPDDFIGGEHNFPHIRPSSIPKVNPTDLGLSNLWVSLV